MTSITQAYARTRGVRVIQILIQDEVYAEPSQAFCEGWVSRYGLTNVELRDPTQVTNVFFPDGSLPSTIIVDNEGVIGFRENGVSNQLMNLRKELDELLAEANGLSDGFLLVSSMRLRPGHQVRGTRVCARRRSGARH